MTYYLVKKDLYLKRIADKSAIPLFKEELTEVLNIITSKDTIIFESILLIASTAPEAIELYYNFFKKGVNLIFFREYFLNSIFFKDTQDEVKDYCLNLISKYITTYFEIEEERIEKIKKGQKIAAANGKKTGNTAGNTRKRSIEIKNFIRENNVSFGGNLSNKETIEALKISERSLYMYKKKLLEK